MCIRDRYHAADEVTRRLAEAGFDERSPGDDLPGDGPVVVLSLIHI